MKEILNETETFVVLFVCILIIVICALSKYLPNKNQEFNSISYNPNSKTVLILENIKSK